MLGESMQIKTMIGVFLDYSGHWSARRLKPKEGTQEVG